MLQGIGYNNSFGAYNRIQYPKQNEETLQNLTAKNNQEEQLVKKTQEVSAPAMDLKLDAIKPRPVSNIEDISLSLNKPSEFEMKGREADIESLDISKAVSDMQKDEALWQYQYFVGSGEPMFQSEDGVVIAKSSL